MSWKLGLLIALVVLMLGGTATYLGRQELLRISSGLPAFTHSAGDQFDTMVAMRDGTRLFTTVQLPDGAGPSPAVLIRSPYAQVSLILRDTTYLASVQFAALAGGPPPVVREPEEVKWRSGRPSLSVGNRLIFMQFNPLL